MKYICILSVLASLLSSVNAVEAVRGGLWHPFLVGKDQKLLFIAYEETELVKNKIGQWLPKSIFNLNSNSFMWKIDDLRRKDNQASFIVSVKFQDGKVVAYQISHFDKGPDEALEAVVHEKKGEVRVSIKVANDTTRDIIFAMERDIAQLQSKYSISKAMPGWSWNADKIIELDE